MLITKIGTNAMQYCEIIIADIYTCWKGNLMTVVIELSKEEIKRLQELSGILVRDEEDAEDAIRIVIENA